MMRNDESSRRHTLQHPNRVFFDVDVLGSEINSLTKMPSPVALAPSESPSLPKRAVGDDHRARTRCYEPSQIEIPHQVQAQLNCVDPPRRPIERPQSGLGRLRRQRNGYHPHSLAGLHRGSELRGGFISISFSVPYCSRIAES